MRGISNSSRTIDEPKAGGFLGKVMGKFGISFSNDRSSAFKIDSRKHYSTVMCDDADVAEDSWFQRCLAWISYIVLVFTAMCAFNSPALASIGNSIVSPLERTTTAIERTIDDVATRPSDPWALRGTE